MAQLVVIGGISGVREGVSCPPVRSGAPIRRQTGNLQGNDLPGGSVRRLAGSVCRAGRGDAAAAAASGYRAGVQPAADPQSRTLTRVTALNEKRAADDQTISNIESLFLANCGTESQDRPI